MRQLGNKFLTIEQSSNQAIKKTKRNYKTPFTIILLILISLVFFCLSSWPLRSYLFKRNIEEGDNLLKERKYTEAYVHFQKSAMLLPYNKDAEKKEELSKKAARNILELQNFLKEKNENDLLKLIEEANGKVCNLQKDQLLIDKELAQIAAINLKFCAEEGPKNYNSWMLYGIANLKNSQNNYIFKEYKPDFRREAARAFEEAYKVDPINKIALEYLVEVYKIENNQEKVDLWQNLLDNLNKIEK